MSATAPYGTWKSPVTAERVAAGAIFLSDVRCDGTDLYWLEGRPQDGGRNVLVRCTPDGIIQDLTPAPFNVRSRVHEYGGGAYAVAQRTVWFVNFQDQQLYTLEPGAAPAPLTAPGPYRYADLVVDAPRRRLICVREDHSRDDTECINTLVSVDLTDGAVSELSSGHDFYASPRLNPAADRLAWLSWDHPDMPWDSAALQVANMAEDGSLEPPCTLAGGDGESVFQPEWSPGGELYFVSDPTGWWNLYRRRHGHVQPVRPAEAEYGRPLWQFGMRTYRIARDGKIIGVNCDKGRWQLWHLDTETGQQTTLDTEFSDFESLDIGAGKLVFAGSSPSHSAAIAIMDLDTGDTRILRESASLRIDPASLSTAQALAFPSGAGETAFGFFYPPRNVDFTGPRDEKPPLIVRSHGGPTSAASASLNLAIQFWTSRGFAVLDVNYRGSTGHGRAYRERLDGQWGLADVEDCVRGAQFLADTGRVDGQRLAIRGGSAGGYTTLAALVFHDVFKAGASYYGISDLEALARDTHKFEARYLDRLVGPYPGRRDLYRARSPVHFPQRLSCPVIFFQGLDDKVVPPNQAQMMVDALRAKGLPVAYLAFEGEQHGFRQASTLVRTLEAELYFYGRIFGFGPADPVQPLPIDNL